MSRIQVFSARSDGTTDESCKLYQMAGTSMATPAVAGAASLVSFSTISEDGGLFSSFLVPSATMRWEIGSLSPSIPL